MKSEPLLALPSPWNVLAISIFGVIAYALFRFALFSGEAPMLLPLIGAACSGSLLLLVGGRRTITQSFMRCGFHLGAFAFFMLCPILSPGDAEQVTPAIKELVGWAILLTVVGFECGYWGTRLKTPERPHRVSLFVYTPKQRRLLVVLVYFGIVAWFLTILDYAASAGVSVVDVLFTMRAPVEGQRQEFATTLSGPFLIVQRILAGGTFLAATAASVLLTGPERPTRILAFKYWVALLVCAGAGFLGGSRAMFLFSFAPILSTGWIMLSRSNVQSARFAWAASAFFLLVASWGAMSAMRGGDIRNYNGTIESFAPELHARGALDIYSQMNVVVQAFPELIPYQRGLSLVPLALGWVPRAVWPGKPYPFSLYMNFLNGETVENRAASIAVGLPGEGYGNFGMVGVFLWAALMGFACRRGDDYIGGFHPAHPLRLQIGGMAGIWAGLIVRGGVPEMFYMGLGAMLLPLGLTIYLFGSERPMFARAPQVVSPAPTPVWPPLSLAQRGPASLQQLPGGGARVQPPPHLERR